MITKWFRNIHNLILIAIIIAYTLLGILYAVLTPPWQAPDEPAHYNYVRYLVEKRRFPVLQPGDYDPGYMREITTARFHPSLSIDAIRYEFHQPPLYYVLAAPIYALFDGALLPLRLLSVALGGGVLVTAYLVGKTMLPAHPWMALGMTALIAFIPQHIAMSAAVENDTLAELFLALSMLFSIRWLESARPASTRKLVGAGIVIGLGLLTKTTAYIAAPLALVAVWLKFRQKKPPYRVNAALKALLALLGPALLLSLPWFARNAAVYGGLDILGLARHEQVVVGQLRTADKIAQDGALPVLGHWLTTMFHSFWAQFGWMAVPIDARIYTLLGLLSGVILLGFCLWWIDFGTHKRPVRPAAILLACAGLMTLASVLWYNLDFYQAQGRYLFPALIPLSLAWVIGLNAILSRENALTAGVVLGLAAAIGALRWIANVCSDKWRVLWLGLGSAFLGGRCLLPDRSRKWLFAAAYAPLLLLCAASPFLFIVPYLTVH